MRPSTEMRLISPSDPRSMRNRRVTISAWALAASGRTPRPTFQRRAAPSSMGLERVATRAMVRPAFRGMPMPPLSLTDEEMSASAPGRAARSAAPDAVPRGGRRRARGEAARRARSAKAPCTGWRGRCSGNSPAAGIPGRRTASRSATPGGPLSTGPCETTPTRSRTSASRRSRSSASPAVAPAATTSRSSWNQLWVHQPRL